MLSFMIIIALFVFFITWYIYNKHIKTQKVEVVEDDNKRYILNVSKVHEDRGVSSHWHGWSSKWLFTHKEALEEKKKIAHLYHHIEILEHSTEQKKVNEEVEKALENSK